MLLKAQNMKNILMFCLIIEMVCVLTLNQAYFWLQKTQNK